MPCESRCHVVGNEAASFLRSYFNSLTKKTSSNSLHGLMWQSGFLMMALVHESLMLGAHALCLDAQDFYSEARALEPE